MNTDKTVHKLLLTGSLIVVSIAIGIAYSLIVGAMPALKEFGFKFIWSNNWDPTNGRENYGALPFIVGTLTTSILALIICLPLSFSTSLLLGEYYKKTKFAQIIGTLVDLLAGIPSIVYGLWGFYVLRPIMINLEIGNQGFGIFTASIILAIMIIPYATSLSNEIISMIPNELKESAYSLGATRLEVIRYIIIPNASSGIVAGYILALGRALGETMAVTMLIGNTNTIPSSIFSSGNTMASIIANQFGEADGLQLSALIAIGLLLLIITAIVNAIGKKIITKMQ